ncbi:MAG: glycosyltransferase family 4 protein [Chloroflexi bacterium]|nr:glycosyltransferase family 4 protein [Chloroflexota bacterium]
MKIALMSPYDIAYPGGVAGHVAHLAEEFARLGNQVVVLAPCSEKVDGPAGVELVPVGRPIPVPTSGSVARLSQSVWLEPRIKGILKRGAFDIVHVHEPFVPFMPWLVVYASEVTTIGTFHAFNERGLRLWFWKPVLKPIDSHLHGRIAVSEAARAYFSRRFPGEYTIIPNGIDVDHFSSPAAPLPQFKDGKLNIVFVGRLEKRKGLRYLLGAFSSLKWEFPNLRLIVVGPGAPDSEAQRVLSERNIADVVFSGHVPYSELPRYYQAADIFCSPAIGRESFGYVIAEAMAAGRAIAASDIPGYRSVVTHGYQALLVRPRSEEALAAVLRTLILDPELRRRLGEHARQSVEQYRWNTVARRVLDYYEIVLAQRRAATLSVN